MLLYLLTIISAGLLMVLIRRNYGFWKKKNIVEGDSVIWNFLFHSRAISEVYKQIYDKYQNESQVGLFIGTRPVLLLRNLENIQKVVAGEFQSFHSRGIFKNPNDKLADNILFIDDYHRWKLIRQKLSPLFTGAKLKNMFYLMDKCAKDFVEMVHNNSECVQKPFNAVSTYTASSLGAAIIGIDTHNKNTMDSPFLDMASKIAEPSLKTSLKFTMLNVFPTFSRILNIKLFEEHEDFFFGVVKNVLEARRKSKENRHDFIDMCLELQKQGLMRDAMTGYELEPTDELLAAQAFFFFLAGADTTASTMHYTLIELANNPEVLEKLHKQIDQVLDNANEEINYSDVEKLQYLDMVLSESLRKYPPIGSFQRICTKATTLPVGNVQIEEDCVVIVPVYALQRDKKYFPNPDLFDPERFSPENAPNIPKFAYLPFGEGNRICIGMRFARLQVKVGLVRLLRRYTLLPETIIIDRFESSPFALRAPNIRYQMVPRQ